MLFILDMAVSFGIENGILGGYSFIKPNEQQKLLQTAGFSNISENHFVYAEQAILNYAEKIQTQRVVSDKVDLFQ